MSAAVGPPISSKNCSQSVVRPGLGAALLLERPVAAPQEGQDECAGRLWLEGRRKGTGEGVREEEREEGRKCSVP